ncbi:MAG: hypothetical protein KIT44_15430, partial [Opitutaceae bacterium]|nr:hypothetical protein [Opitutaceae bacterium]
AYDALGNVHGMIQASDGTLVAGYEYDAYGKTLRESGPYAEANPFRFATKYTDLDTELVYHDTRYYSPSLGRFINRDSIGEQGGLNLYAYISNRVPNAWDYLGMNAEDLAPGRGEVMLDGGGGINYSIFDATWSGRLAQRIEQDAYSNALDVLTQNGVPLDEARALAARIAVMGIGTVIAKEEERLSKANGFVSEIDSVVGTGEPFTVQVTNPDGTTSRQAFLSLSETTQQAVKNYMLHLAAKSAGADSYGGNGNLVSFVSRVTGDAIPEGLRNATFRHDPSGFRSGLYQHNGTGQYILAYAGTHGLSLRDWWTNLGNAGGAKMAQYERAAALARDAAVATNRNVLFVGHSLGGGLATVASAVTGLSAVTVNAAGVPGRVVSRVGGNLSNAQNLITAYYVRGEILSLVQDLTPLPNASGTRIPLPGPAWSGPFRRHMMGAAMSGVGQGPNFP